MRNNSNNNNNNNQKRMIKMRWFLKPKGTFQLF